VRLYPIKKTKDSGEYSCPFQYLPSLSLNRQTNNVLNEAAVSHVMFIN
jgi:hypothetical protein